MAHGSWLMGPTGYFRKGSSHGGTKENERKGREWILNGMVIFCKDFSQGPQSHGSSVSQVDEAFRAQAISFSFDPVRIDQRQADAILLRFSPHSSILAAGNMFCTDNSSRSIGARGESGHILAQTLIWWLRQTGAGKSMHFGCNLCDFRHAGFPSVLTTIR